jgi:hypothetical protein
MPRLTVIRCEEKKGVAKGSGNPYSMVIVQCVVPDAPGGAAVGELVLPKDHLPVAPGEFEAEVTLGCTYDHKVIGMVTKLTPVRNGQPLKV